MANALRKILSGSAILSATLVDGAAGAVPREGDVAPDATLEDADGSVRDLNTFRGRPVLIVYEDRESSTQNRALKDELAVLARSSASASRIALAAVADVSAWDFEPAKHFVRAAIRDESKKQGTTIYCDWTGAFRSAYRLRRGMSNVVLVSTDGRVIFAAEGALDAARRAQLINRLKSELEAH